MTIPIDFFGSVPTPKPPKPCQTENREFSAILAKINEQITRLDDAESILSDIHNQLEKTGEISTMTAARLRIFMEGK